MGKGDQVDSVSKHGMTGYVEASRMTPLSGFQRDRPADISGDLYMFVEHDAIMEIWQRTGL
jgi:hypothetical protein